MMMIKKEQVAVDVFLSQAPARRPAGQATRVNKFFWTKSTPKEYMLVSKPPRRLVPTVIPPQGCPVVCHN